MNWKAPRPGIEIAAEWIAAGCLGGAAGFAAIKLAPAGPVAGFAIGVLVAGVAWFALMRVDCSASLAAPIGLVGWPGDAQVADDVLLLDDLVEDELLLDDPIVPLPDMSRVVRLFDAAPSAAAQPQGSIPAPGEMITRIADFLDGGRGGGGAAEPAPFANPGPANAASEEASAALHAALADIRRSLRHG